MLFSLHYLFICKCNRFIEDSFETEYVRGRLATGIAQVYSLIQYTQTHCTLIWYRFHNARNGSRRSVQWKTIIIQRKHCSLCIRAKYCCYRCTNYQCTRFFLPDIYWSDVPASKYSFEHGLCHVTFAYILVVLLLLIYSAFIFSVYRFEVRLFNVTYNIFCSCSTQLFLFFLRRNTYIFHAIQLTSHVENGVLGY